MKSKVKDKIVYKNEVNILMATYNGEKYVSEQIESLINQSFTNWSLLIRDDGSTDNTMEILDEYEKKENRITIIRDNLGNLGQSDNDLAKNLFPERILQSSRKQPDCEYIHKEMAKSGVTLSLLWNEYCEQCRFSKQIPFMYTQFCKTYRDYANITKATMHIKRKPGEMLEVDWAGNTAAIIDNTTGDIIDAYVFVASLSW